MRYEAAKVSRLVRVKDSNGCLAEAPGTAYYMPVGAVSSIWKGRTVFGYFIICDICACELFPFTNITSDDKNGYDCPILYTTEVGDQKKLHVGWYSCVDMDDPSLSIQYCKSCMAIQEVAPL